MTNSAPQNTVQPTENRPSDKELNFRMLETKYEKQLQQERQGRLEAERMLQEASKRHVSHDDDDEDDDVYVNPKKLNKTLAKYGQQAKQETHSEIQKAVGLAIQEERKQTWLKNNSDFYDVLQHAEKFAQSDPELAETILQMPEGFERQKLVYKNIKALGIHKPPVQTQSIQDTVDSKRKGPYYQPSGVGTAPYAGQQGNFSPTGQKEAYAKMQDLIFGRRT